MPLLLCDDSPPIERQEVVVTVSDLINASCFTVTTAVSSLHAAATPPFLINIFWWLSSFIPTPLTLLLLLLLPSCCRIFVGRVFGFNNIPPLPFR